MFEYKYVYHMYRFPQRPEGGIGTGVRGTCKLLEMGAGN